METRGAQSAGPNLQKRPHSMGWLPHFEINGSLLYLQPGAGNLEYG
jgi:hypothetical protein